MPATRECAVQTCVHTYAICGITALHFAMKWEGRADVVVQIWVASDCVCSGHDHKRGCDGLPARFPAVS